MGGGKRIKVLKMGIYGPSWKQICNELVRLGPREVLRKVFNYKFIKVGTLVGTDHFGNEYYENRQYPYPKDRWVEYNTPIDASTVPAEWFGWLHHMVDFNPNHPQYNQLNPIYRREHIPNLTGTKYRYLPHGHLLNRETRPISFVSLQRDYNLDKELESQEEKERVVLRRE